MSEPRRGIFGLDFGEEDECTERMDWPDEPASYFKISGRTKYRTRAVCLPLDSGVEVGRAKVVVKYEKMTRIGRDVL